MKRFAPEPKSERVADIDEVQAMVSVEPDPSDSSSTSIYGPSNTKGAHSDSEESGIVNYDAGVALPETSADPWLGGDHMDSETSNGLDMTSLITAARATISLAESLEVIRETHRKVHSDLERDPAKASFLQYAAGAPLNLPPLLKLLLQPQFNLKDWVALIPSQEASDPTGLLGFDAGDFGL